MESVKRRMHADVIFYLLFIHLDAVSKTAVISLDLTDIAQKQYEDFNLNFFTTL